MKANELRIGNLIHIGTEGLVFDVSYHHIRIMQIGIDNSYTPIPLTEEWLVNFGFIKENGLNHYTLDLLTINTPDTFHKEGRVYFNSWAILEKQPQYVHQLQNLYFALTGQELVTSSL